MSSADEIRDARVEAGMTKAQLAQASGVRQPNIASYENGRRVPSEAMRKRLLSAAVPRPSLRLASYRNEVLRIALENHATNVRVFGSVARDEDHPGSDIDLLVTFAPEATLLDQAGLMLDLEELLGCHVDVLSDRALRERDQHIVEQAREL